MKYFTFIIALGFSLSLGLAVAKEHKKDAALAPVGALGKVSEGEKKILLNQMESELSRNYTLISQQDFKQAQLKAFEELEAEECTEEACIRKIQELLQVDRLFSLQVIREGKLTQFTLSLIREDDKIVRTDQCRDCDIFELNEQVGKLVNLVVLADLGLGAQSGEVSQLLTDIIEKEKELKSRRNSKMNRAEKDYYISYNLFSQNVSDYVTRFDGGLEFPGVLELGKYSGDFLYGLKYGADALSRDTVNYKDQTPGVPYVFDYEIDRTEFGVFGLWFFGTNSATLYLGLSQGSLKMDGKIFNLSGGTETFVFTADMKATFLTIGIGNQWITDHGSVWQFEWLLWKPVLSSSKSYTVLSNSFSNFNTAGFENFLEDRIESFLGGVYLVSFHLGYSF